MAFPRKINYYKSVLTNAESIYNEGCVDYTVASSSEQTGRDDVDLTLIGVIVVPGDWEIGVTKVGEPILITPSKESIYPSLDGAEALKRMKELKIFKRLATGEDWEYKEDPSEWYEE